MSKKLLEISTELICPILSQRNMELVDIETKKEGGNLVLRVYIDHFEGGITIDEIGEVSTLLSKALDEKFTEDLSYVLEVSSPGVERVLKKESDFVRFKGKRIDVALFAPLEGKKKFCGILSDYKDGMMTLSSEDKEYTFERDKIAKVNLHFEFK